MSVLVALLLFGPPAVASAGSVSPFVFGAGGEQEVPPVETAARGGCGAVFDVAQLNIVCAHNVEGATAAHIHVGAPGEGGPVVFDLGDPSISPFSANWPDVPAEDVADLFAGNLYVNIHSTINPGGEIRGQIVERTIDNFVFPLDESQEVPPTGSQATGVCSGDLSDDSITLSVVCSHEVSMATAAHVHRGGSGSNGPVLFDFGDPTSPLMLVTPLLPGDLAELAAGLLYVNVHSGAFPGGEIRGQMVTNELFADGFENGDTSAWTSTVP